MSMSMPNCGSYRCFVLWSVMSVGLCMVAAGSSFPANTLLLRYDFDEPAGAALDHGVNPPANGILQGEATRTVNTPSGFSNAALDLNGISTDFVSAGDPDKLDGLTTYSVSIWLNSRDTYLGTGRILGKHDLGTTGFDLITSQSNASGFTTMSASEFSLGLMQESGFARSTVDVDAENKWVFIGMTYDATKNTDNLRFYTGSETSSVSILGSPVDLPGGLATNNAIDFTVGGAGPIFADLTLPARIDDVRIYNGVLAENSFELIRRNNLSSAPDGDFNDDLIYDCTDIDLLTMQIASGVGDLMFLFDLNQDGIVDGADLDAWLTEAGAANLPSGNAYLFGDADLDGSVDGLDYGVWNANKFTVNSRWCSGDFNADGVVDGVDFTLWNANKFSVAASEVVPEPATMILLPLVFALLATRQITVGCVPSSSCRPE